MTYTENILCFTQIAGKRNFYLEEEKRAVFWVQDDGQQVRILGKSAFKSFRIDNPAKSTIAFVPMDGKTGMFKKSPPPVKDETLFRYRSYSGGNHEEKTAGACECLILDTKWRFFELKTETTTQNENQAAQQREKAMMQLGRTVTFFKEQAEEQKLEITDSIEAIMVFPSKFPAETAANINRGPKFFKLFKVPLKEVSTDGSYLLN